MTEKLLLLALFFATLLLWVALNGRSGRYDLRMRLDAYIPFVPVFVLAYLGIFALIALAALFLLLSAYGKAYLASMDFGMLSASVSWYFLPAKSFRPVLQKGRGFLTDLVLRVYEGNPHGNAFPSVHVFSSFITAYYISLLFPLWSLLFFSVAVIVALSTVFIKQHHIADVIAGIVWAAAAVEIGRLLVH